MSTYDQLYRQWAQQHSLGSYALGRTLAYALRQSDAGMIHQLLMRNKLTDEQRQQVSQSTDSGILRVWLDSSQCPAEERAALIRSLPIEMLRKMYPRRDRSLDEEILKALWKRRDAQLRIQLIPQIGWSFQPPERWGRWLVEQLSGELLFPQGIRELIGQNDEYVWEVFSQSSHERTLEALANVYQGLKQEHRYNWHREELIERLQRLITSCEEVGEVDSRSLTNAEACLQALWLPRSRNESSPSSGSLEMELGLRVLALLEGEDADALRELLGIEAEAAPPLGRAALLQSLTESKVAPTLDHLRAAASAYQHDLDDELWEAVSSHPRLRPSQAVELVALSGLQEAAARVLLQGRGPSWQCQFVRQVFSTYRTQPAFQSLVRELGSRQQVKVLREIIEEDPGEIHTLDQMRLVDEDVLGAVPASQIGSLSDRYGDKILRLNLRHLGEDSARWEVVESLVDEYTGSYEELLRTAGALIEVQ